MQRPGAVFTAAPRQDNRLQVRPTIIGGTSLAARASIQRQRTPAVLPNETPCRISAIISAGLENVIPDPLKKRLPSAKPTLPLRAPCRSRPPRGLPQTGYFAQPPS